MTNGEQLISDFPYIEVKGQDEVFTAIQIDTTETGTPILVYTEWWNAEYKELTIKNDLGVECIDRKMALDTIQMKWKKCPNANDAMQESIDAIREMPSVTPQEPKVGHWITTRTFMHDGEFYCDKCKNDSPNNEKWDYCPNCGAKMESEDKE